MNGLDNNGGTKLENKVLSKWETFETLPQKSNKSIILNRENN